MDLEKDFSCLEHNDLVYHKCIDCDDDYQETLQQYSDDILRVIKCDSNSYISTITTNSSGVEINGKTIVSLSYLNDNSEMCYADFERDFSKKINIDNLSDNSFATAIPSNKYCNFRLVNQRRIDVHVSLVLDIRVFDKHSCPVLSSCCESKLKKECVDSYNILSSSISKIEFDEEFSISSSGKSIKRIISNSSNIVISECKIIKDKALIKANVSLCAVYSTDDECIDKIEHSFELSKIIDIDGINEEDLIISNAYIGEIYLKAKNTSSDTINTIEAYGEIELYSTFVTKTSFDLISDGYILGRTSKCNYKDFKIISNTKHFDDIISENLCFLYNTEISDIYDMALFINKVHCSGDKISINIISKVLCKNSSSEICYLSSENTVSIDSFGFNEILSSISIDSFSYNIESNNKICVRLNLKSNIFLYNIDNVKVLCDLDANDEEIEYPALTVYFARKNESVWEIAKRFLSDMNNIKTENNLNIDVLESNKVLIIPGV